MTAPHCEPTDDFDPNHRLFRRAIEVFESADAARAWFARPLKIFHGRTPAEMIKSPAGAEAVEQALGRIEHGVFT
jgi:putative toxin-antitoxin system antitoxin component (TIGR02293 family)